MANLYGRTVKKDQRDFLKVFNNQAFRPDELKIYPCSLIASAPLMRYFKQANGCLIIMRNYSLLPLLLLKIRQPIVELHAC
jgi:hypothetical protein